MNIALKKDAWNVLLAMPFLSKLIKAYYTIQQP